VEESWRRGQAKRCPAHLVIRHAEVSFIAEVGVALTTTPLLRVRRGWRRPVIVFHQLPRCTAASNDVIVKVKNGVTGHVQSHSELAEHDGFEWRALPLQTNKKINLAISTLFPPAKVRGCTRTSDGIVSTYLQLFQATDYVKAPAHSTQY